MCCSCELQVGNLNMSDLSEEGIYGSELFNFMRDVVESDEKLKQDSIKKVNSVVVLTLKNKQHKQQSWVMDFKKEGTVKKLEGRAPKSNFSITMSDNDFVKLVDNKVNAQKLFMSGKLKVKGDIMKAASIETFLRAVDPRPKAKL